MSTLPPPTSPPLTPPSLHRGQIYYINLTGAQFHETTKTRPCVIIQNDKGNLHSTTTIIAPITTKRLYNHMPTHVNIAYKPHSTTHVVRGTIMAEQIRTVSKKRIINYYGELSEKDLKELNKAIAISLGL